LPGGGPSDKRKKSDGFAERKGKNGRPVPGLALGGSRCRLKPCSNTGSERSTWNISAVWEPPTSGSVGKAEKPNHKFITVGGWGAITPEGKRKIRILKKKGAKNRLGT